MLPVVGILMKMSSDLVAVWDVPMNDGVRTVEFEHGTLTGKRVIRVNGKVCHGESTLYIQTY